MKALWLLAAALLAGCGAQAAGTSSPAPSSRVTASSGQFRAEAAPARLAAGGNVHYRLVVKGPVDYEAGCAHTLTVWAEDAGSRQVWSPPVPQFDCLAIMNRSLGPGETARFDVDWPTSPTLPAGRYTIHGLFLVALPPGAGARVRENLPPLQIEITR